MTLRPMIRIIAACWIGVLIPAASHAGEDLFPSLSRQDSSSAAGHQPTPGGSGVRLDAFFRGIEQGCFGNSTLRTAINSMMVEKRGRPGWNASPRIKVPDNLRPAFGTPRVVSSTDEYTLLEITIKDASFLGFPVTGMQRWAGHHNGISGFAFTVDAPRSRVEATVNQRLDIVDSCTWDEDCGVGPFKLTFHGTKGGDTTLICDTSN